MRWRPSEVDLGWRRPTEALMRTEVGVVDEAELDCCSEVFRCGWPQEAQPERVLQRPPQPFDQGDRAFLPDRPETLLHSEPTKLVAKAPAREAGPTVRDEV